MKQTKTTPDSKEGLHTQGEWKFDGLECILSESGEIIADIRSCNHDGEELENQVFNRSQEEAEANAELIVKAVNNYPSLVDENKNLTTRFEAAKIAELVLRNERKALLDKVIFIENELVKLLEDIKQDVKDWYYYNIDQIDSFDGSEKELQKKYAEDIFDRYQRIQTTIKNYYGNKVA